LHGERKIFSPSSFIEEIDASTTYFERLSPAKSGQFTISLNRGYRPPTSHPQPAASHSYEHDEYSQVEPKLAGKFARHNKYGRGKVIGQSGTGENTQLEILFADGVKRKFVLKLANLRFE